MVTRWYCLVRKADSIKTYITTSSLHKLHLVSCWIFEINEPVCFNLDIIEAESFLFVNLIFGLEAFENSLMYPVVDVSGT